MKNETKGGPCESVSNERVNKFYLKSVHEATYNISSEELLKPTLHK
jgi:hypothetical protein